jgi:hypothetical protein
MKIFRFSSFTFCVSSKNREYQDRQYTYNVILNRVRVTICALEKEYVLYILPVCVVALGIQHAMHMGHIVICGLSGSTIGFHIIT